MLEKAGHQVVEAPDGEIGARLFRQNPTDIVITDLIMPEKEGLELIMELRKEYPDIKIIAISGGGRMGPEQYLPLAEDMGANYTFAKPFGKDEILEAIQDLLKQS